MSFLSINPILYFIRILNIIPAGAAMGRHIKFDRLIIAIILPISLLLNCVSKENIKVPSSEPMPHPMLARMQSLSIEEKDGVIYFGQSKKYQKRGITVVSLKGEPYEIGYAHGVLLKDEMIPLIREIIHWAKAHSFGTSWMENTVLERAREAEQYIPEKYITELKGIAAGSGIDYEHIMALNTLSDTADSFRSFFCTSVAVKRQDGKLIRSRSLEYNSISPSQNTSNILYIYQPSRGYAFASVSGPLNMGVGTAMNETGLNLGEHSIRNSPQYWKGIPNGILNRKILENAASVEEAGEILRKAPRSRPVMQMVTDTKKARIYEYDSEQIGYKDMDKGRLILTNYTHVLNIGAPYNCTRFSSASNFLNNHRGRIDVRKLVELNRNAYISRVDEFSEKFYSIHLAIFIPETLDFWIAVDPPPASRGRWVGFNLKKELDGSGREPSPLIIPAMSDITIADDIKVNEKEPWTGKWKVESNSYGSGIWTMQQEGKTVKSSRKSAYEFEGKVQENQIIGKVRETGIYFPIKLEMTSNGLSFTGTLDYLGRIHNLHGKRIE